MIHKITLVTKIVCIHTCTIFCADVECASTLPYYYSMMQLYLKEIERSNIYILKFALIEQIDHFEKGICLTKSKVRLSRSPLKYLLKTTCVCVVVLLTQSLKAILTPLRLVITLLGDPPPLPRRRRRRRRSKLGKEDEEIFLSLSAASPLLHFILLHLLSISPLFFSLVEGFLLLF
jgi:hypothetical protein